MPLDMQFDIQKILSEEDDFSSLPITNLSLNSKAAVQYIINRLPDAFSRLRQCEQIIHEKTEALEENWLVHRKKDREIAKKERELCNLEAQSRKETDEELLLTIEELKDEIYLYKRKKNRAKALIRDAYMELSVALEEKTVLINENPEFSSSDYVKLQETYGNFSFKRKIINSIAVKLLGRSGIPEEMASLMLELPESQWEEMIKCSEILVAKNLERISRHLAIPEILGYIQESHKQ